MAKEAMIRAGVENMEPVIQEISRRIQSQCNVKNIILFGSYAQGRATVNSDIDIIVVLDQKGFAQTYWEQVNRRLALSKTLLDIKRVTPIDLLVYTEDEWERVVASDDAFFSDIRKNGVYLI